MDNVRQLFPDHVRLESQQALQGAIRQQLAAAVGMFQRTDLTDANIVFALERMTEAADLVRILHTIREHKTNV
jgi:hypothetical protein